MKITIDLMELLEFAMSQPEKDRKNLALMIERYFKANKENKKWTKKE